MPDLLKKYPFSIAIVLLIVYLSFFKPPTIDTGYEIPHLDKVVHFCMYFGLAGIIWWEFLRSHKDGKGLFRVWFAALLFPILFSGGIELLQEYATEHRGGEWLDFAANSAGALFAALAGYYILRPRIISNNESLINPIKIKL